MKFGSEDVVFVDESKANSYILAATATSNRTRRDSEKALRSLLKPGQRRIHFKSESNDRRRLILANMCDLELSSYVWMVSGVADKTGRPLCMEALARAVMKSQVRSIVIERDESLVSADRRVIAQVMREHQHADVTYSHVEPQSSPLLWVSDAVAWSVAKGGDWRRRIAPLTQGRIEQISI